MIKLNPNPEFQDGVNITVPGQKEPGTIQLTFKYRGRDEYKEWLESLSGGGSEKSTDEAFLEFVTGWGLEEEFNRENVGIFLNNYPMSYAEIFKAYSKLLFESRVKN